jgi:hypothetical protein
MRNGYTFLSLLVCMSSALPFKVGPLSLGTTLLSATNGGNRAATSLPAYVADFSERIIPHPSIELNTPEPNIPVFKHGYNMLDFSYLFDEDFVHLDEDQSEGNLNKDDKDKCVACSEEGEFDWENVIVSSSPF